jgi:uncharacterized protein YjaZ
LFKKYDIGFHAITVGAGKIIVSIDPTFDNWQQLLPYALAHEYHHSVWTSRNFTTSDFTPLEYLVLEGRADFFAMKLFPITIHPFINRLTENQERTIWSLIKPQLNMRNSSMNEHKMYGTEEIPYGSVYAIEFNIIKSFKTHNPKINDNELIDLTPAQILLLSKYDDKNESPTMAKQDMAVNGKLKFQYK